MAWVRLLGLSLGSTSAAVATVLTAFFGGMAAGAAAAGRVARTNRVDLLRAAAFELAIGASGLLLLPVLVRVDALLELAPAFGTWLPARFALSVALLSVPTFCMGAIFPLVAGAVTEPGPGLARELARLYVLNTAGAVAGALASGFVLVPALGLVGAVALASTANFAAAALALAAARQIPRKRRAPPRHASPAAKRATPALVVLAATGSASIALEVGWTKALAILTGATLYGYAAILAIFLSGLAAGSLAVRARWLATVRAQNALAVGLLVLAALVLASRPALTRLPDLADALTGAGSLFDSSLLLRCALALPVLFPPAFVFGALYPVSLAWLCGSDPDVARKAGLGTAVNTLAGIAGSVVAGLVVIPTWGTDALLATVAIGLALASLPLLGGSSLARRAISLGAVATIALLAFAGPRLDYRPLLSAVRYRLDDRDRGAPDYRFLAEGRAAVVSVTTRDGLRARLESNGIQESWWQIDAPQQRPRVELLLALAPVFLHEGPHSAFVVGYGAGHTVAALTWTELERIRVVELEPAIVDAVRTAGGDVSALADPRVELAINDARNALLVEDARYDLVVSQPSHPWLAGAGNLFTRDFFAIVAARLAPGGIHAQWLNLFRMDEPTLRSILRAFFEVHAHGLTLVDATTADMLLIGSARPLRIDWDRIQERMRPPEVARALTAAGWREPRDLLRYFALSRREALRAAGAEPPNTDLRLLTESRLARLRPERPDRSAALALLSSQFGLDLEPFFAPGELPRRYYEAGRFLAARGATTQARQAVARLRSLDPALAGLLERDAFAPPR
jgi:spermidine synthase